MLLPAAISAAASYVTFAAFIGTDPILPVAGQPPFNLVDLGGAAAVGLVCGVLARVFVATIRRSQPTAELVSAWVRVSLAGSILAGTGLPGPTLSDTALTTDTPRG